MCNPPVLLSGCVSVCIGLLPWGLRPDHTEGREDQRLPEAQESRAVSETSNLGFRFSEEPCLKFLSKILS